MIAIIDADLIGRDKHRFPNLACMKISGYYKELGYDVILLQNYANLENYEKVFISKVFTDTEFPDGILYRDNVYHGGSGFYYDKAIPLSHEIEHHMPDYHLYDDWVESKILAGEKKKDFEYYLDYSIGFTTRGCFRKCGFCINKNYNKVEKHSYVNEFLDVSRKYICLLDDNILGYCDWEEVFNELIATKKPFQFKQGMDERILTEKKIEVIKKCKYKGDLIFAFDNIEDKEIIIEKLKLLQAHINTRLKFYVLCGFDKDDKYDKEFWLKDIENTFERIKILMEHQCLPYIMRFNKYEENPYRGTYINLAGWCNQPHIFKMKSYKEYCEARQENMKSDKICSPLKSAMLLEKDKKEIADKYYDIKFKEMIV